KRRPSAEDLADVDIMLFDIQDVGVRYYTFISSLQEYMEAAFENKKPLIILDRPNPNGFYVDGPILDTAYKSFIGMQPIPVVYGMTIAEYA
ncbi:exo-beta-N-acetylmuramidase NamZ domain-containing protein, partial [Streptomyces turgidiscabies]|uniref:exo-beta-N-acetylmuramidase NamZ domain-containing protein n=1 Tax=Streptomyces turgidiscabies TaxID=85558 RepID=UPI0038F630BD